MNIKDEYIEESLNKFERLLRLLEKRNKIEEAKINLKISEGMMDFYERESRNDNI